MENTGKIINDTEKTKTNKNDFSVDKLEGMFKKATLTFVTAIADMVIELPKEEFCKQDGMKELYAMSYVLSIKGKISELEKNISSDKFTDEDYDKIIENLEPLNNMLKTLIKGIKK